MEICGCAAIVTGGGAGLGSASARALAAKGAKVTVLGRRKDVVTRAAGEFGGLGLSCDVSDYDSVTTAVDAAEAAHGTARILINCAADGRTAPLLHADGGAYSPDIIREVIGTNLLGLLYMTQTFAARLINAPELLEGERGVVINVSSSAGSDGAIGAAYSASKGGVNALGLSLAREFSPWGIRVMTVAPGGTDTDRLREHATPEFYEAMKQQYVFPKRLGKPSEFADLAVHICENGFLNGSLIRFDGGIRRNDLRPISHPDGWKKS
jgi:NAD(P)-dependent dehydrogenase (short-subunit alcohol dehydrogenase family)